MSTKEQIIRFIKDEVKDNDPNSFFREPLVGFSSAQDELYINIKEIVGKHHIEPKDILAEAETVVSFFIPFTEALVKGNRGEEVSEEWAVSYIECNALIAGICEKLIKELAKSGVQGAAVKATHGFDETILAAAWSHRSAAYIAGLGRFGRNKILITEKGGAGRYGSLVISEVIRPDVRQDKEFCLFYSGKNCTYCIDNCPVQALTADGFDRRKCYECVMAVNAGFPHLGLCDVCGKCSVGPCSGFPPSVL